MQGEAGGDGERVRHNARKHDLHDAPELSLGVANRSAKRRHTTGSPGHYDDESTSNSSSSYSRGQKVKNNSTSRPPKSPLNTRQFSLRSSGAPAQQKHDALKPPTSSDLAARSLGGSGGLPGARLSLPGGPSSGHVHHKAKQNPLPNAPPTSSSTSSDASSIPAGSTGTLPSVASKEVPQKAFPFVKYGFKPANRAAAREGSQQSNDKPGQETKSRKHTTTIAQRQRSDGPGNALPTPRLDGTRKTPHTISSSDDESYVDEVENNDEDNNADVTGLPTTRQRSARLRAQRSAENISKGKGDDGKDGEHEAEQDGYRNTPSGKDYHHFLDENSNTRIAKVTLFPDGYKLRLVPGLSGFHFPCPVRTCPRHFKRLEHLEQHFEFGHKPSEFNDNLDKDGTLEYIRRRESNIPASKSIIVSQNPRDSSDLNGGSSFKAIDKPSDSEAAANSAPKGPSDLGLDDSPSTRDAEDGSASTTLSELHRAMAESKVWAFVAPLVPNSWTISTDSDTETRAFIQAISLPLRNDIDRQWLSGTKNSHQRLYRALMSVILQAVGVEAHCKPCESKILERKRNCKVLPPEAAGMRELQEVCGSQCVNCYFFQASKPCEFPDSSTMTKQTPVPVPILPILRTVLNVDGPVDPPPATRPPPAANRPPIPSYSSYKATKVEKPISESPVPIPSFATQGSSRQSEGQDTLSVSSEKTLTERLRRSSRISKTDSESGKRRNIVENHDTDEAKSSTTTPATSTTSNASKDGPMALGGSNAKASPASAPHLSLSEITNSQLAGRMSSLFGDIGRLPAEEQSALWHQMLQMSAIPQTGSSGIPSTSGTIRGFPPLLGPLTAADGWEIAPGRLIVDDKHLAFSTSFLSRDVISLNAAQQLSPTRRVLNNSIPALKQLRLVPEEGWNCTCSVLKGLLKMKIGDVEARIGQGGVISVEEECIITNLSHKEARIQVWWVGQRD